MGFLNRRTRNKSLVTPETYGFEAVDQVRDRLLKINYERFPENQLESIVQSRKNAVASSSIGGRDQLAEEVALDQMLIDMRVPHGAVRREAGQWWLDLVMNPDSNVYKELKVLEASGEFKYRREFYGS
jgi:hypothetical protein